MEQQTDNASNESSILYSQMPDFSKPCIESFMQLCAPSKMPSFCKPSQQDPCHEIKKGNRKERNRFRYSI